jgi:hypothetical protein
MRAERDHSRLVRRTPARTAWRDNRQTNPSEEKDAICYCTYWAPIGPQLRTCTSPAPSQPCVCVCAHTCVCAVTRHACPHARVRSISYNLNRSAAASTWNARFAALLAYPVSPYMPTVRQTVGIIVPLDYRKPPMQRA